MILNDMTGSTPGERSARGRIAAHSLHAQISDPAAHTAPARAKSPADRAYWEARIDPDGTLDDAERSRRAEHARKAYFTRLALASARARRRRAESFGRRAVLPPPPTGGDDRAA